MSITAAASSRKPTHRVGVGVSERRIEVYREPRANGYASMQVASEGEAVAPAAFPGVVISVADRRPTVS